MTAPVGRRLRAGGDGSRVVGAFPWFGRAQHREVERSVTLICLQEHGGHHAYLERLVKKAADSVVLIGLAVGRG